MFYHLWAYFSGLIFFRIVSYFISKIASISNTESIGKEFTPTADLACFPFLPKIFTSILEAEFTTSALFAYLFEEFKYTLSFRHDFTLFKFPEHAFFNCATILIMQIWAASIASFFVISFPNLPINFSLLCF